jgi:hypothetical protein
MTVRVVVLGNVSRLQPAVFVRGAAIVLLALTMQTIAAAEVK